MKKDLISNLASVRCLLMICIVSYHSMLFWHGNWFSSVSTSQTAPWLGDLAVWMNSFHIYGFVFLSGYLFYYLFQEKYKYSSFFPFVLKKAKRLLIPYVSISCLWAIPFFLIFGGTYNRVLHRFVLGEGPAQLWFLLMLFGVFVAFYLMYKFLHFICTSLRVTHSLTLILCVCSICIGSVGAHCLPNFFQIWQIGVFFPCFCLGFYTRMGSIYCQLHTDKLSLGIYVFLQILLFAGAASLENSAAWEKILKLISFQTCHLLGAFVAFHIFALVTPNKFIDVLSETSFGVYLFHQQIIYVVLYCLINKASPLIVSIVCFLISYTISFLLTHLLQKNKYLSWILGK